MYIYICIYIYEDWFSGDKDEDENKKSDNVPPIPPLEEEEKEVKKEKRLKIYAWQKTRYFTL